MFGVVSMPVQSFVSSVKRIGDRTVPCVKPVEIKREDKVQLGDELFENDCQESRQSRESVLC